MRVTDPEAMEVVEMVLIGRVNKEIVEIHPLSNQKQEDILKPLIYQHCLQTKSFKGQEILKHWETSKKLFKVLLPPSEKEKAGL